MKKFLFKLFIGTLEVGRITIDAKDYDSANKILHSKDVPFCHHMTVETVK